MLIKATNLPISLFMLSKLSNTLAIHPQTIFNQNPNYLFLFQLSAEIANSSKTPKEVSKVIKTTAIKSKAPKKISELSPFTILPNPVTMGNQ